MLHDKNLVVDRHDMLLALVFGAAVFVAQLILTLRFQSQGVFDQWNVVFDADPNAVRAQLAHGWSLGSAGHPLMPYFFSVPFRFLSIIAAELGMIADQEAFREILALGVPAFLSAIKTICIFLTFRILRLHLVDAILATLITILSFSSLIFGSTPSSYALSGAAIALITLFSLIVSQRSTYVREAGLGISAIFAIGTTISNVVHYGWMLWARYGVNQYSYSRALIRAILAAGLALLLTLSLSWTLGAAREGAVNPQRVILSADFINQYKPSHMAQLENAIRFPETLARSYIPTTPLQKPNVLALKNNDPIKFELSYNGIRFGLGTIALWLFGLAILFGALIAARMGEAWRLFGSASAASILTTGGLFSWFGINTFLYSQYWQVPAAILVGAWVNFLTGKVKYGRVLVVMLAISMAVGDIYVLSQIDAALVASAKG